jgi:glycerate 2-kinase
MGQSRLEKGLQMPIKQGMTGLKADAGEILEACLKAADPESAVKRIVRIDGHKIVIGGRIGPAIDDFDRIIVVGAGKGSAAMGKAVEDVFGDLIHEGVICVKYDHGLPLKRIRVLVGRHPLPDGNGRRAAQEISQLVQSAGERDLVISCISGGGSALLPSPAPPITLEEKQLITDRLLAVGADIHEINAVRKHISLTKGGNLMRRAYPAFVLNLMLSDVIGDDPGTIASGPFAPDGSTFSDALSVLDRYGLTETAPIAVVHRLRAGSEGSVPENPKASDPIFKRVENVLVGTNIISLEAGERKAREMGYNALILSSTIEGDTTQAALFHASVAAEIRDTGHPVSPPACVLTGGETTVVIRGTGLGGRNQEFALSLVEKASQIPGCLFLSVGTDGTDGPTDAAGAITDTTTSERARSLGMDPKTYLEDNDSYHFFERLDDLAVTGPTRTNVMDVRIVLVGTEYQNMR